MKLIMLQTVLRNWNFFRLFRLLLGLSVLIQAILLRDWMMALFGAVFTSMPLFNYGCCGMNGCSVPLKNTSTGTLPKDVVYEEVDHQ